MTEIKTVVLGVTGSIAAYKGAELCSKLVGAGFNVRVVMTESATKLVAPKTFLTLSRNPVVTNLWDSPEWKPDHISLAAVADFFLVAPCTANFMGKMAAGIADDALSAFAISYSGPTALAPAMNPRMWAGQAVQANLKTLGSRGLSIIGPAEGKVACSPTDGPGRMEEPEAIFEAVVKMMAVD